MFNNSPLNRGAALLGYNPAAVQQSLQQRLVIPGPLDLTKFATAPPEPGLQETLKQLAMALDAPLHLDRQQAKKLQDLVTFAQGFCLRNEPGCVRNYERPFIADPGNGNPRVLHQLRIQHIIDSNEHLVLVSFIPRAVFPPPHTLIKRSDIDLLPIEHDSLFAGFDCRAYILDRGANILIPHNLLKEYDIHMCAPDERYTSPGFRLSSNKNIFTHWATLLPAIQVNGLSHSCRLTRQGLGTVQLTASVQDRKDGPLNVYRATIEGLRAESEKAFMITNHGPARCFVAFHPKQPISSEESASIRGMTQKQFDYT
jgi:hypothetical protein